MRVAERPLADQPAGLECAGDAVDHADFKRLGGIERRQDARKARRQHGFPGARRPDHQQIVAAGGGDLECALGRFLALDVAQVRNDRRLVVPAAGAGGTRT